MSLGAVDYLSAPVSRFRPYVVPDGRSPQREFLKAFGTSRNILYRGGNRSGKGGRPDDKVLTPSGWSTYGSLSVGDEVIAEDGTPTKVTGVFRRGLQPVFRLRFDDDASCVCDGDHLWKVMTREDRFPRDERGVPAQVREDRWRVLSLRDILDRWGDRPSHISRVAIPVPRPIQFTAKAVPVDPYLLGVLLGDGSLCISGRVSRSNPMLDEVRSLGIAEHRSWQKFVPDAYKFNSVDVRLAVLQGLLDTDGTVSSANSHGPGGHVDFGTTSERLADDVIFLVRSLGGKARRVARQTYFTHKGEKAGRPSWRVHVRLPGVPLFRLRRKLDKCFDPAGRRDHRLLVSIEPLGEAETICISVDHPSRCYVVDDFVVTHNTVCSAAAVVMLVEGYLPWSRFRCPMRGWVSCLDWDFGVGQVYWPAMKPFVDPTKATVRWHRKTGPEIPATITWRCGCEVTFKSADSGARKYQGSSLHFVFMDEEHDSDVVEEARARLVSTGGYFVATLTPLARKEWVRRLEKEAATRVVRASMRDAAAAGVFGAEGLAEVDRYLATLPDRQRLVREFGDHAAVEGLVYPEFDRAVHVLWPSGDALVDGSGKRVHPWPIPASWPRHAAIDFGMDHLTAVVLAARDPSDGSLVVERCWAAQQVRPSQWAKVLAGDRELGREGVLPPLAAHLAADHDAAARAELVAAGVPTQAALKEVEAGVDTVGVLLHHDEATAPRLRFIVYDDSSAPRHPTVGRCDCAGLVEEIEGYRYPRDREGRPVKDLPVKRNDDRADSLRYCVMSIFRRRLSEPPALPPSTLAPPRSPVHDAVPPSPFRRFQ